jgi:hypothetical protein
MGGEEIIQVVDDCDDMLCIGLGVGDTTICMVLYLA